MDRGNILSCWILQAPAGLQLTLWCLDPDLKGEHGTLSLRTLHMDRAIHQFY